MREREGEKAGDETAGVKKRTTKIYSMCGCLSTAVTVVYKHSCNTSCNTIMCVHRGNGSRVYSICLLGNMLHSHKIHHSCLFLHINSTVPLNL